MRRVASILCVGLCACSSETSTSPPVPIPAGTSNQVIRILNYTYSPQRLVVAPGSTVLVINEDAVEHTVTSAAAPKTYVFGEVAGVGFDVDLPPALGAQSLSIPASAPPGTVIPYFCRFHGAAEINQGEIEIAAP